MPSPPPFPICVEDLTTDMLTTALGVQVAGFSSRRIGADRGMLGEIFLIDVDAGPHSRRIIAKFAALREATLASAKRGRNYERELRCYESLLADTPVETPACHGTWYDPAAAHFLLLQDEIETDDTVDQIEGIGIDHAELVIREMAALHAHWWDRQELTTLDWLPRLDADLRITNLTTLAKNGWQPLTALLGASMSATPAGFGATLPERIESALRSTASQPPFTLLHCDLRADNLLFSPAGDQVTIIDWQGCGLGPPAFDLAYFLTQSLTIEDRRNHEADLIDLWLTEIGTRGVNVRRSDSLAGFADSLWYGMAVACALPLISDPDEPRVRDLASAVAERTLAALRDHGQIDS